jgi:hypothetical protein
MEPLGVNRNRWKCTVIFGATKRNFGGPIETAEMQVMPMLWG